MEEPSKATRILTELLAAGDEFVSGNDLADKLGISRVSIWGHMEKMRSKGFEFDATRSKGYRLVKKPDTLNQELIQAYLPKPAATLRIEFHEELDSTNTEAERQLANGDADPFVVIARRQTAGRGRLGREWHSQDNGNLYATFAFRPEISPARLSTFTLWMGVNLAVCINAFCRLDAKVKWPNDLLINGKKAAGILTEARMDADQTRDLILGIGLNINGGADDFPEELSSIATSLRQAVGNPIDANRLTAALAGRVALAYKRFVENDHWNDLKTLWAELDALRDQSVSLIQGQARISGIARGIDANGALILEREDGSHFHARAGEVTLEKPTG